MPFGIHKASNRSKGSIAGAVPSSGLSDDTTSPAPTYLLPQHHELSSHDIATSPSHSGLSLTAPFSGTESDPRAYPAGPLEPPAPAHYAPSGGVSYQQHSQLSSAAISADDLTLDSRKLQPPARTNTSPLTEQPKKSKSLFDRMRAGAGRSAEQKAAAAAAATANPSSYNNTAGLARRLSKRSENPPVLRTAQQRSSLEQQWQSDQRSQFLPSPQEGLEHDDDGLDPFLIRHSEPEEEVHTSSHPGGQQTIRSVQNDPQYRGDDGVQQPHHQQQAQGQRQHSFSQVYYQPSEQTQQNNLQISSQGLHFAVSSPTGSLGLGEFRPQNLETVSQLSYESLVEEPRPVSGQSTDQSPVSYIPQQEDHPTRSSSISTSRPLSQYSGMAPASGTSQQNRRPADPKQSMQNAPPQDQREGLSPGYRQQFSAPPTPAGPPANPSTSSNPNYQGGPPQRSQYGAPSGDQGRSTPPPSYGDRDVNEAFKEMMTKYKKVKGLYFEKTAQVEQLQNTLANQRLSQSRTSLDDSEYMTRFQRLDGATTNLAFNIRKDWRSIPPWLSSYVNLDAHKIGKQEMTAVGRACITRFLVDEIFNRTFHPGLESSMSTSLKGIEQNIRRFSPTINNQEESDALTGKVVQWRLSTLDGLRDALSHPSSDAHKKEFTQVATTNLTASLINFLQEPVPAGIAESAHMIVELAVSIASNLPLESRDINIVYPLPGDPLLPYIMKVEQGVPPLEHPPESGADAETSSTGSGDREESGKEGADGGKADTKNRKEKSKSTSGMLQAIMGGGSSGSNGGAAAQKKASPGSGQTAQEGAGAGGGAEGKKGDDASTKVRFAGFVGVEVRGRQMLGKAPVWTVG